VARRPLPRILSTGSAQIARSRELARTAADSATDVLHPLITITRGLRRLASAGRRRWAETPKDKRGPLLFLAASVILVVVLVPYGPLLAVITLAAAAAWQGRDRTTAPEGPDESQIQRLQVLYEALVPYFSTADDPAPLYAHGGDWEKAASETEKRLPSRRPTSRLTSVVGSERTLSSSTSGALPKWRKRAPPNHPDGCCTATPTEATRSTAPGMKPPAGSNSVKRPCDQARSASSVSQSCGVTYTPSSTPRRRVARLASVAPASPT